MSPVFRPPEAPPPWGELDSYSIVDFAPGRAPLDVSGHRTKVVVVRGALTIGGEAIPAGRTFDIAGPAVLSVEAGAPSSAVIFAGRWSDETGGAGVFAVEPGEEEGDRNTRFDRHYHDCDEYWVILEGRAVAESEDQIYDIAAGDCVATAMGYHHDMPRVRERILGVFFETTLRGQKRRGHLWENVHGKAVPRLALP